MTRDSFELLGKALDTSSMLINHLMIGAQDVAASVLFYCEFLGFRKTTDDPGSPGGMVLEQDACEILILPFAVDRLPNPKHFALEVSSMVEFERLFKSANEQNLKPRKMPSLKSDSGITEFPRGSYRYKIFYISDPTGVIVELMVKIF